MERLELEVLEDSIRVMEAMEKFCGLDSFEKLKLEFLKELKGYRILQEQGRLLELPCAVGDMLYIPSKDFHRVEEYLVEKIEIDSEGFWVIISSGWVYDATGDFGKKYFLTREEAEEALKRMVDGNEKA